MYPVLLNFGIFSIHTFGFFVAMGVLAGLFISKNEAIRLGIDQEKIMDLYFYVLLAGIIGARTFYIITEYKQFVADPVSIFKIWQGGLVFYGGFIGAVVVAVIYIKFNKLNFWETADIASVAIPIAHFSGRIGCFFAGCCYGKDCILPWAVIFTHPESLATRGIPLHPTQLYSSLANLLIFGLMMFLRKFKRYDGQLFLIYVFIYGIVRSIIEIFRADNRGGFLLDTFSISQTIGLSVAFASLIILFLQYRKTLKTGK